MRFWDFNVCELIRNEKSIKSTLAVCRKQIAYGETMIEDPLWGVRGEWEVFVKVRKLQAEEYQLYADMIDLGFQELPEVERLVLRWWLQDGYSDDYIIKHLNIKNPTELMKIRKIAEERFRRIVMPD